MAWQCSADIWSLAFPKTQKALLQNGTLDRGYLSTLSTLDRGRLLGRGKFLTLDRGCSLDRGGR